MRLSFKERVAEFFNLLLLSIILPTLVTISDMFVAYQMFSASEVVWFLTILTPIILNFLFTVLVWWKMEKAGTKRWSWLFLLILAWPQWKAANLVRLISWKGNMKTGTLKKKEFYKSISPLQPVLQSTAELILKSLLYGQMSRKAEERGLAELLGPWYLVIFATSLASLAVEMTRFMVIGPCRVLLEDFNWGSVLTFLCCLVPCFAIPSVKARLLWVMMEESEDENMARMAIIWAIFFILPQAILALVSIHSAIGFNSAFILKSTLQYLLLVLNPVFSVFTFGIFKSAGKVAFSPSLTLVNVLLTSGQFLLAAWLWPRSHHLDLQLGIILAASGVLAALLLLAPFLFPDTWIADVVEVQQRVLKPGKRNTRSTIGESFPRGRSKKIAAWA